MHISAFELFVWLLGLSIVVVIVVIIVVVREREREREKERERKRERERERERERISGLLCAYKVGFGKKRQNRSPLTVVPFYILIFNHNHH